MALTPAMPLLPDTAPVRPLVELRDLRAGLLTTVVLALVGAPLGLLWSALAPRAAVTTTDTGALILASVEDKAFVGADLLLFALVLGLGVLAGVVGFGLGRRRGPGVVIGLVLGCYLAGTVAVTVGALADARQGTFEQRDRPVSAGVQLAVPNRLLPDASRSWVLYLGGPAAAALMFGILSSQAARREREDQTGADLVR